MSFFCRGLLVLVALACTSGCATSFVYDRADRLANRWVGGYVDLDAAQQEALDQALAELHEWHRREQLPRYADWLRVTAERMSDERPLSPRELHGLGEDLGVFWRELARAGLPMATEIGAGLDEEQVAELLATLREVRGKQALAVAERPDEWHQQRRARSMERFFRRWTGRLTADQRAAIQAWSASLEPSRSASLDNRAGWIDELGHALARRDETEVLHAAVERLFVAPGDRWDSAYAALIERNTARTTTFMAEFLARMEDRQRQRTIDRLRRLATEFDQLADVAG